MLPSTIDADLVWFNIGPILNKITMAVKLYQRVMFALDNFEIFDITFSWKYWKDNHQRCSSVSGFEIVLACQKRHDEHCQ